eukprot:g5338.t1
MEDCLYRAKGHVQWLLPSLDLDEFLRPGNATQLAQLWGSASDYLRSVWDEIVRHEGKKTGKVRSISFDLYRYQRAPPNQLEMFSEKRSPLNGGSPLPKYAANVRKVQSLWVHWPQVYEESTLDLRVNKRRAKRKAAEELEASEDEDESDATGDEEVERRRKLAGRTDVLGLDGVALFCLVWVITTGVLFSLLYFSIFARDRNFFKPLQRSRVGKRLGSSQPVVAVTNDRRLRRLCADSGCETPEVQWRRWSATRRRPALGFSGWVSTLKSGIFVEMLSSVPVGPLLPQLRSVHEEV